MAPAKAASFEEGDDKKGANLFKVRGLVLTFFSHTHIVARQDAPNVTTLKRVKGTKLAPTYTGFSAERQDK
ncbi:MAG: hypothetical protein Q9200_000855 [Gallowayella weberi]